VRAARSRTMVDVQVSAQDLTRVRFASSAAWEIASSLRVLAHPRSYPLHARLVSLVPARPAFDLRLLLTSRLAGAARLLHDGRPVRAPADWRTAESGVGWSCPRVRWRPAGNGAWRVFLVEWWLSKPDDGAVAPIIAARRRFRC
jgi:hypothetical protein